MWTQTDSEALILSTYGRLSGRGDASSGRYVVLDDSRQEKELVNLEMVRIKKGGQKNAGLEIFLKNGCYEAGGPERLLCRRHLWGQTG